MAEKFVSKRNLDFLLFEVFDVESLTEFKYFEEHSREIFDMVLETAIKMGTDMMRPCLVEMDQSPPEYVGETARVHPTVRAFMQECGEGGWIGALAPYELGGQQLPQMIMAVVRFIWAAANYSLSVYPGLTTGASDLIETFGNEEQMETYVQKMFAGQWGGTMALTEPQAGSSLSDITTTAEPTDLGYYLLRGQKIFISAADHDGVENVINLMLAKIKGAPPGVKGISLFIVPKKRIGDDGELEPNDIVLTGIYHKLGYRGTPLTQLSIGDNNDCRAYLVGEPHRGLFYMFRMMNGARLEVGIGAAGIASAAYYTALEYTKERPQGRRLTQKDPTLPQVPIIEHADVKRMLLFQRAIVEGSIALNVQCAKWMDLTRVLSGEEEEKYALLLDLLTPVAKSYPSEMGVQSVSQAIQCLGGYGYCDEFPVELFFRDSRIHPIHEGTTGIQGQDILGRKVIIKDGQAYKLFIEEVHKAIAQAEKTSDLKPYAQELKEALDLLEQVTSYLVGLAAKGDPELFLADATLYLEFFSIIVIAWQWLVQAIPVVKALSENPTGAEFEFYQGKFYTCQYFFGYELPKTTGLAKRLLKSDGLTVKMTQEFFND